MHAHAGKRVQIRYVLLQPDQRAAALPADTAATPYVVVVKGLLQHDAELGHDAAITTATGRTLRGELVAIDPGDTHTFGRPVEAFVQMIVSITELVHHKEPAP